MLILLTLTTPMLSPLDDSDIRAGATGFSHTKTALALSALSAMTTANLHPLKYDASLAQTTEECRLPSADPARGRTAERTPEAGQKVAEADVAMIPAASAMAIEPYDRNASSPTPLLARGAPAGGERSGPTKDLGLLRAEEPGETSRVGLAPDDGSATCDQIHATDLASATAIPHGKKAVGARRVEYAVLRWPIATQTPVLGIT